MGKRRKRLIVQADITSEEDAAFLQWIKALRKRRRLGEAIRQGLWLRYRDLTGRGMPNPPPEMDLAPVELEPIGILPQSADSNQVADRLKNLVQGF